jgi:hypothetical protein
MTLGRLLSLLPALTLSMSVACLDGKDDDDEDEDEDEDSGGDTTWGTTTGSTGTTGTSTGTNVGPLVSVNWGSSAVELSIEGGPGAYWFGIAETSGCNDCWTGEDCVFGYDASGTFLAYCHDSWDEGTSLSYGGAAAALAAGTTVFPDSGYSADVTYYLESDPEYGGDGSCYTWGDDTRYYDGLGCTNL